MQIGAIGFNYFGVEECRFDAPQLDRLWRIYVVPPHDNILDPPLIMRTSVDSKILRHWVKVERMFTDIKEGT